MFGFELDGLYLNTGRGVWVLDGIFIMVGLRPKCTRFGVLKSCPVGFKVETSFVQLPRKEEQPKSAPRKK